MTNLLFHIAKATFHDVKGTLHDVKCTFHIAKKNIGALVDSDRMEYGFRIQRVCSVGSCDARSTFPKDMRMLRGEV